MGPGSASFAARQLSLSLFPLALTTQEMITGTQKQSLACGVLVAERNASGHERRRGGEREINKATRKNEGKRKKWTSQRQKTTREKCTRKREETKKREMCTRKREETKRGEMNAPGNERKRCPQVTSSVSRVFLLSSTRRSSSPKHHTFLSAPYVTFYGPRCGLKGIGPAQAIQW